MISKKVTLGEREYLIIDDNIPVQHADLLTEARFSNGAFCLSFASAVQDGNADPIARMAARLRFTPQALSLFNAATTQLLNAWAEQQRAEGKKPN